MIDDDTGEVMGKMDGDRGGCEDKDRDRHQGEGNNARLSDRTFT
jgi:hypothetical protein